MSVSCHTYKWLMPHTKMSHGTRVNEKVMTNLAKRSTEPEKRHQDCWLLICITSCPVCCSVLQRVAVYCSVLQCIVSGLLSPKMYNVMPCVLRCVAVCCGVLHQDFWLLKCITSCLACCSVLQCVAVRCNVFIQLCGMTRCPAFYETWLIHTCDLTHSYVRHDTFIRATWLIALCITRRDSLIFVTWLVYKCDMTHCSAWYQTCFSFMHTLHESFTLDVSYAYVTWRDVIRSCAL